MPLQLNATHIDYLEPYLSDPKKWTKEQITDFSNDGLYFLAYAGIGPKKPGPIALHRKLKRPEGAWPGLTDLIAGRQGRQIAVSSAPTAIPLPRTRIQGALSIAYSVL